MTALTIDQVSRTFPARRGHAPTRALEPINLSVGDNDFVTILGPSGCGKSTLLRIVAGLDRPTSGRVILGAPQFRIASSRSTSESCSRTPDASAISAAFSR